jgi:chemotaxis protein MotB
MSTIVFGALLVAGAACSRSQHTNGPCTGACLAELTQANDQISKLEMEIESANEARDVAQERSQELRQVAETLKTAFAPSSLQVELRNGMVVLTFPDEILFDFGSFDITPQGEDVLYGAVRILQDAPISEYRTYLVAGHTDDRPVKAGNREYSSNLELSTVRSLQVVKFLLAKGVPAELLGVAGFGQQRPMASNATREGRAKNRRTEIILLPTIDKLPTLDESSSAAVSLRDP